jgi:CubicO group peptidase (beta-lactamase class C family)
MMGSRRAVAFVAAGLLLVGCGSSATDASSSDSTVPGATSTSLPTSTTVGDATTTTTAPTPVRKDFAPDAFDRTDALLEERVGSAGSRGMIKIVAADGTEIHEHSIGGMSGSTPIDVASSTKWLTAVTFMTFVDDGAVKLDDNISKWLPEFAGSNQPITARQLLDHTSGVHDNQCQNGGATLATCVDTLASSSREFPAGSAFSYGNAPFLVVGRLIEVLGGTDFASVVQQKLTGPLGMDDTTWPGAPAAANPAFGVRITVDDYGKLLDMILHEGVSHGARILSKDAVTQLVTDQVSDYDTSHDYSVGITGIPRYGIGCWPDVVDQSAKTEVVSGNGGKGLYPWVDFTTQTWGVVGVQDERGAQFAVPASQKVEVEARTAVAR